MDGCSVECNFTCELQGITNTGDTKFLYTDKLRMWSVIQQQLRILNRNPYQDTETVGEHCLLTLSTPPVRYHVKLHTY